MNQKTLRCVRYDFNWSSFFPFLLFHFLFFHDHFFIFYFLLLLFKFLKFQDCTLSIVFSYKILPFFILFIFKILPYFHFFSAKCITYLSSSLLTHTQLTTFTTIYKELSKTFSRHIHLSSYLFFYQIFPVTCYFCFFLFFFYDQVEIHETYFAALKIRVEELRPILMKISRRELVVQVRCLERRRMRGGKKEGERL